MTQESAPRRDENARQPVVAVFVVIFTVHEQKLKVLLIRRDIEPFRGWWAIPGGRLGVGEPLDEAAARKLVEETGVRDVYLEQLYTFGDLDRTAPTGAVAIGYFALVDYDSVSLPKREGWPTAWFSISDLPASPTGERSSPSTTERCSTTPCAVCATSWSTRTSPTACSRPTSR